MILRPLGRRYRRTHWPASLCTPHRDRSSSLVCWRDFRAKSNKDEFVLWDSAKPPTCVKSDCQKPIEQGLCYQHYGKKTYCCKEHYKRAVKYEGFTHPGFIQPGLRFHCFLVKPKPGMRFHRAVDDDTPNQSAKTIKIHREAAFKASDRSTAFSTLEFKTPAMAAYFKREPK